MGAATAIMYLAENSDLISAAILDSPFSSVKEIADHIAINQLGLSKMATSIIMVFVKASVFKQTKIRLDDLAPEKYAPKCKSPVIFIHG